MKASLLPAMLMLTLLVIGCVQIIPASGPRKGEVTVKSPDGRYSVYLTKEPTNNWKRVTMKITGCEIEVPVSRVGEDSAEGGILLYYVRLPNYPDGRYAAQVIVRRKTKAQYEKDISFQKESIEEWRAEGKRDLQWISEWEWRCASFHPDLAVNQHGTLYRRDIRCSNGDVIMIEGSVEKLAERESGMSLYTEMDSVVRRIINSIRPLNVTTNN